MRAFFDSNVFLYAFLDQGSEKKRIAAQLIADAVRTGDGWISLQVVREFTNVMLKKSGKHLEEIKESYAIFGHFKFVEETFPLTFRSLEIKAEYGLQYFDSLIVATAEKGICEVLYSEDFNDGQIYAGVKALNPFKIDFA